MKVVKIPDYNEFERFIYDEILGNNNFNYGSIYDFDRIVNSFIHAEESLITRKTQKIKELESEDPEVRYHMVYNDFEVMNILNPEIQVLRNSLSITLHSQFEKLWIDILEKYQETTGKKFGNKKINFGFKSSEIIFDNAIKNHRELFGYSLIRDSFAHKIDNRKNAELLETIQFIKDKKINNIEYKVNEFEIIDIRFGSEYSSKIFAFIQDILEISYNSRKNNL